MYDFADLFLGEGAIFMSLQPVSMYKENSRVLLLKTQTHGFYLGCRGIRGNGGKLSQYCMN